MAWEVCSPLSNSLVLLSLGINRRRDTTCGIKDTCAHLLNNIYFPDVLYSMLTGKIKKKKNTWTLHSTVHYAYSHTNFTGGLPVQYENKTGFLMFMLHSTIVHTTVHTRTSH